MKIVNKLEIENFVANKVFKLKKIKKVLKILKGMMYYCFLIAVGIASALAVMEWLT